jgi:hypothetical protein
MSEDKTKQPIIYVPGTSVKEHSFDDGFSIMRFSINLERFAPFAKSNKNEKGYINLNIVKRREIGTYGETHSVSLDTWKPTKKEEPTTDSPAPEKQGKPLAKKTPKSVEPAPEVPEATSAGDFF